MGKREEWLRLDWYPVDLDALMRDGDQMTPAEFGWYCRLWLKQYRFEEDNRGLPNDPINLCNLAGAIPDDPAWERFLDFYLEAKFPLEKDGYRHNRRTRRVFVEQQEKRKKAREKAAKAGIAAHGDE